MRQIGTRELKQHTGEIISRVRSGEQLIIALRGRPVAILSPIDQTALQEAIVSEANKAKEESLGWLKASERAFSFWDNEEDVVWDEVKLR